MRHSLRLQLAAVILAALTFVAAFAALGITLTRNQAIPVRITSARTMATCGSVECIQVPYLPGPRGAGDGGIGLTVYGSAGWGGTLLSLKDSSGAPEMWFRDGGIYVLVKPGWLGQGYCLDVALQENLCLGEKEFRYLIQAANQWSTSARHSH